MTQEVLQSLPVTRQRHSLLAVGKNLLNIPDDDPRAMSNKPNASPMALPIVSPPQQQLQKVTLVSSPNLEQLVAPTSNPTTPLAYESCKPFKKRVLPDTGFGSPVNRPLLVSQTNMDEQRNAKLPRTVSADNVANVGTSILIASNNTSAKPRNVLMDQEDQENRPNVSNVIGATSSSLIDLGKACEVERTKNGIKTPSPNYFGASRSLLRNSPINLSMDRRNAHIISPLALTTHNRSNGFAVRVRPSSHIIPPSPTTPSGLYRKGPTAPSPLMSSTSRYIKLSPTMTARGSPLRGPQQSPVLAMRKPFSPTSLLTLNSHKDLATNAAHDGNGQKIKVLRMPSQENIDRNSGAAIGNSASNMRFLDLNSGKTVIALVSKNSGNMHNSANGENSVPTREINSSQFVNSKTQSPRSSAINLVQRSPAMYRLSRFASN